MGSAGLQAGSRTTALRVFGLKPPEPEAGQQPGPDTGSWRGRTQRTWRGHITKAGSGPVRSALIEAA